MDLNNLLTRTYKVDSITDFWANTYKLLFVFGYEDNTEVSFGINTTTRQLIFHFSEKIDEIIELSPESLFYEIYNFSELKHYEKRTEGEIVYTKRFVLYIVDTYTDSEIGLSLGSGNVVVRSDSFPKDSYKFCDIDDVVDEMKSRLFSQIPAGANFSN